MDGRRRAAPKKRLHVEQPGPVYISGNKNRIGRALANLLINALKFGDKGSVRVTARPNLRLPARTVL